MNREQEAWDQPRHRLKAMPQEEREKFLAAVRHWLESFDGEIPEAIAMSTRLPLLCRSGQRASWQTGSPTRKRLFQSSPKSREEIGAKLEE
jgi:hypothetical protein